jgi:hypothetical protein
MLCFPTILQGCRNWRGEQFTPHTPPTHPTCTDIGNTGKSMSETLLSAEHGESMLCTKIVLNVRNNFCTQHVLPRCELGSFMYWSCNSMNNLSSYCGLVDAKIRASVIRMYLTSNMAFNFCLDRKRQKRFQKTTGTHIA